MNHHYRTSLFIFRRDLRLEDNTGLLFALENSKKVIPCFIFTPEQIENNSYRGDRCLQFMLESLENLSEDIRKRGGYLYFFYGEPAEIINKLNAEIAIDAIILNKDYTPYSLSRDQHIQDTCKKLKLDFHFFDDVLLHPPQLTLKSNGEPYKVFTPYHRHASQIPVAPPKSNPYSNFYEFSPLLPELCTTLEKILPNRFAQEKGGRAEALQLLDQLASLSNYSLDRDFPNLDKTSHLSPHLKFTTCSPREVYYAIAKQLGSDSDLLRSLYWRDFFTHIAYFFPYVFKGAFNQKFDGIQWENNPIFFERWCQGKTGFPLVDAGMRQLNATGFMHNRVRMVTASFLVKDLHIDWRWGEKYFANHLIDYDPAVNNGNWQWSASTGCDAQPYFRIFNPWNQSVKFDADATYIRKWVPELVTVPSKAIHQWDKYFPQYPHVDYPEPIIEHAERTQWVLEEFQKAANP